MRPALLLILCYFASLNIYSQRIISGKIIDATTQEPLSYATISFGKAGAYANEDGFFRIKLLPAVDSLKISYVGYEKLNLAIRDLTPDVVIPLRPSTNELEQVTVLANDEYLYELLNECRKQLNKWPKTIAKGYFQLATTMDSFPVEVMQTYYNIVASGKGLEELQLKAGRIANHPTDSLLYRSLGTTQGLVRLGLSGLSQGFAPHPLQLPKGKVKRSYQLTRRPDLSDDATVHIQFDASEKRRIYFSGEAWIDKETFDLRKLILRHDSLTEYPFFPLRKSDQLGAFDIELIYTFAGQRLQHIQWQYDYIHQVSPSGEPDRDRAMRAEGVLLSFDPDAPFYRPRYQINGEFGDYRKISFFPYDSIFWATAPSIPLTQKQEEQLAIFANDATRINFEADPEKNDPYQAFTRGNLIWQADSRIAHSDSSHYLKNLNEQLHGPIKTYFKMEPVVQLFLDINPTADSLRMTTKTIFDVFSSKIEEAPSLELNAALNIYFDLCEIIRRDLAVALAESATDEPTIANAIYDEYRSRMEKIKQRFWAEVNNGEHRKAMERYNEKVMNILGINNLETYGLYKYAAPERELIPLGRND